MSKHGPFGPNSRPNGPVAEWLCRGLQSPVRRFDSGPGLQGKRHGRPSALGAGAVAMALGRILAGVGSFTGR